MGKTERKKELLAAYKEREPEGGVCLVRNAATGRVWLCACPDAGAQRNRFDFAAATGTPIMPAMAADFSAHGAASFTFEVAEPLRKKSDQTDRDYREDLKALGELWRERLAAGGAEFYHS